MGPKVPLSQSSTTATDAHILGDRQPETSFFSTAQNAWFKNKRDCREPRWLGRLESWTIWRPGKHTTIGEPASKGGASFPQPSGTQWQPSSLNGWMESGNISSSRIPIILSHGLRTDCATGRKSWWLSFSRHWLFPQSPRGPYTLEEQRASLPWLPSLKPITNVLLV